jgi:hypothetical protein
MKLINGGNMTDVSTNTDLLKGFGIQEIEKSPHTCLAVDADFNIIYVNEAYNDFAADNGDQNLPERFGIGSRMLDAISGPQRDFFRDFFEKAMATGEPSTMDYECSSATDYRLFRLHAYPLHRAPGLFIEHALAVSKKHEREPHIFREENYRDDFGILHQCGHCRRIRHLLSGRWD